MFCSECGTSVINNAKFCANCGTASEVNSSIQRPVLQSQPAAISTQNGMGFGESITTCFSKYADFTGRASRPEYWWFYLFGTLIGWGINIVAALTIPEPTTRLVMTSLVSLAFFLPSLAVGTRRLHDTDRSGWNMLWVLTIIGVIPVVIWLASKSDENENRYGRL